MDMTTSIVFSMAVVLIVAAFAWVLDRNGARGTAERDADREERQILLQRIQAPQVAVVDHSQQLLGEDPDTFPMSDAEIAEQEERQRALAFIERYENPGGDQ